MAESSKKEGALVKNAASEKQVKRASEKEKFRRENELKDLVFVLSHIEGRRFVYRLVNELCHYDADDFNNSGSITFRSLGERNIGRLIKSDCCEASLNLYQKAEQENWKFITQGD